MAPSVKALVRSRRRSSIMFHSDVFVGLLGKYGREPRRERCDANRRAGIPQRRVTGAGLRNLDARSIAGLDLMDDGGAERQRHADLAGKPRVVADEREMLGTQADGDL